MSVKADNSVFRDHKEIPGISTKALTLPKGMQINKLSLLHILQLIFWFNLEGIQMSDIFKNSQGCLP